MKQLGLDFLTDERAAIMEHNGGIERPKAEQLAAAETSQKYPLDSKGHLRRLVAIGEYMIYLYGQNPHLCFIRTHCSQDNGTMFPIMRKDALRIMGDRYRLHCGHEGPSGKAVVYLRKQKKTWKHNGAENYRGNR